ncbi:MAG: pteridine reductase [Moraxellaceae bacterium]
MSLPHTEDGHTTSARVEEKVVLITGAAQRLGASTARLLHSRGWRVLVHCRQSRESAAELAAELNMKRPNSCAVLQADLSQAKEVEALAGAALAQWQRVDALVNNASSFYPTPVGEATQAHWDELFSSNARAPFFLAQALAPELTQRQGAIVNMLDIHAEKPLREHTLYCMAKAAAVMMTQSLARELAPAVRVNGIAPGAILWPSTGSNSAMQEKVLAGIPLQRLGEPADIANTIAFLLEDAPYITGQIIAVDGGRSL